MHGSYGEMLNGTTSTTNIKSSWNKASVYAATKYEVTHWSYNRMWCENKILMFCCRSY